jgi:hypothetical protein
MLSTPQVLKRSIVAVALIAGMAGCQTTGSSVAPTSPTTVAESGIDIDGTWTGMFTNIRGNAFPISFTFKVTNGEIAGSGDIPSSSTDKNPSITGSLQGRSVAFSTSSGFHYDLTLNEAGTRMSGDVRGPNSGTATLSR